MAIQRTTPALLGLFSLVTLFAHQLLQGQALPVCQPAWYTEGWPMSVDTLAFVRQQVWLVTIAYMSSDKPGMVEIPCARIERRTDTLAFAA